MSHESTTNADTTSSDNPSSRIGMLHEQEVRTIETDEDKDSVGCGDRDDVFGVFSVGPHDAKLGVVWSESPGRKRQLEWSLGFNVVEEADVKDLLSVPCGVLEPRQWGCKHRTMRKRCLWNTACSGTSLLSLEKSPNGLSVSEHNTDAMDRFFQIAQSQWSREEIFALCLKALSVSRGRPQVFLVFAQTRHSKPDAAPWLTAMIDLQCGSSGHARGVADAIRILEGGDSSGGSECSDNDSDSTGSDGISPDLDRAWREQSKPTHKLFKFVKKGDIEKVNDLMNPKPAPLAPDTEGNQCLICRESLTSDDRVVALTCYFRSGCSSVFHAWCCRKWMITEMRSCPLCRAGTIPQATFQEVNLEALDGDGFGVLHHACYASTSAEMLKVLLRWGCDVNRKNAMQEEALHMAAMYRHPEHIQVLLAAGANAAAMDHACATPLRRAKESFMGLNHASGDTETAKLRCIDLLSSHAFSTAVLAKSLELREEGNQAFKQRDFQKALACYVESIRTNATDCKARANCAAVYLELGKLADTNSEKRLLFQQCCLHSRCCVEMDPTFEKGHYRLALAEMGLKDFPGALRAVKEGLNYCKGSTSLHKLGSQLKACGIPDRGAWNPFAVKDIHAEVQAKIASGWPTVECAWCKSLLPLPLDNSCPRCACNPSGSGVGGLPSEYGLEWKSPAESIRNFSSKMAEMGHALGQEGFQSDAVEVDEEHAAAANAPISEALLRNALAEPIQVVCLEFTRHPRGFHQILRTCAALKPCRSELVQHGFDFNHSTGAYIFVSPEHHEAVAQAIETHQMHLHPRHVLVALELEELVIEAVETLPSSFQVRVKGRQVTPIGVDAPQEGGEGKETEDDSFDEDDIVELQPSHEAGPSYQQSLPQPFIVKRTFIDVEVRSSSGAKTVSTSEANSRVKFKHQRKI